METDKYKTAELQKIVDDLKTRPEFKRYVEERKLSLIDSRLEYIDLLLNTGILK